MSSIYNLLDLLTQPVNAPFFDAPLTVGDEGTEHSQAGSVSRRHHHHGRRGGDHWQALTTSPRLDIHETDAAYKATLEIPGCKKEDIELSVDESKRRLTISGSIKSSYQTPTQQEQGDKAKKDNNDKQAQKATPHVLVNERVYGSFQRSFTLPQTADLSKTSAKFEDGLLHIDVAKKQKEQTEQRRTIRIA